MATVPSVIQKLVARVSLAIHPVFHAAARSVVVDETVTALVYVVDVAVGSVLSSV